MDKISIIIPIFNEKDNLLKVLEKVESVDFKMEKEIILVDDFSTDGTRDLYQNIPHKVFYHSKNLGKGAAIRTGIKEVSGSIVLIQDADLEYEPQDYIKLVQLFIEEKADVVYGSRLLSKNNNFLLLSYIANQVLSLLTRVLYKTRVTDMETCYKVFRAELLKSIEIKSNRFDFEPEITAKLLKKGVKYLEAPISYSARKKDEGKKIGWRDGVQAILTLLKYKFVK